MQKKLELVRKRLVQVSKYSAEPWKFKAIPEFAPESLDGALAYYQLIVDYMASMPEAERQKFETMKDDCGCTGRILLIALEAQINRVLEKRKGSRNSPTMYNRVYYLPVRLTSHNGGSGSHSYFAVRPVPKEGADDTWPLTLSPDGMHLLYIHPSQLYTAPDAEVDTLEELIAQKRNALLAAETAEAGTIQPGAKRD